MKEELKTTKKQRILRILLQLCLFLAVIVVLWFQLKGVDWEKLRDFRITRWWALILAVILLFANQGIEYLKWRCFAVHLIEDKTKIRNAFFAGLASGFLSPNGWGNVVGRAMYSRKRTALMIVLTTGLGNLSQLLPTLVFGAVALSCFPRFPFVYAVLAGVLSCVLLLVYVLGEHLIQRTKTRNRLLRHLKFTLLRFGHLRTPLLLWSTLRFMVFTAQFVLLFVAVGYSDWVFLIVSVWLIYALTSFIPSLWSGKILIRESAALLVFAHTSVTETDTIAICLLIWLINIVIPSLIGSFALIPLKRSLR